MYMTTYINFYTARYLLNILLAIWRENTAKSKVIRFFHSVPGIHTQRFFFINYTIKCTVLSYYVIAKIRLQEVVLTNTLHSRFMVGGLYFLTVIEAWKRVNYYYFKIVIRVNVDKPVIFCIIIVIYFSFHFWILHVKKKLCFYY